MLEHRKGREVGRAGAPVSMKMEPKDWRGGLARKENAEPDLCGRPARHDPPPWTKGIDRLTWRLTSHTGGIYAMRVLRGSATCRQEARDRAIHVLAFCGMLHARSV